jgi:2-(1,2-epoxy-1,2-dihydrophenyl)acetyl-CoA isomerase
MSTTETTSPPELTTMRFESDGTVGTLTLARPDALNAMSPEMIAELVAMAQWLADRASLRALVVTGEGAAFSSGGDVNSFREGLESDEVDLPSMVRRGADMLHQAIVDFRRIPFPVVAAVNGAAAGAGFSLALMCDVRIASDRAFFAVAYGRIGAAPDGGMTYFLPRVLGPARALELLLEDPNLSAQDALERGLVTKVVPADELVQEAHDLAAELAKRAPHYVRMCKRLVAASLDNSLADHLQLERHAIADSMATADLARAVPAFFSGETPVFTGE